MRSPPGSGRERDANGVADAFLQQHAESGGGGDNAFRAHAGFGKSEVQRVVAARGERAVDVDQVLHAADFGAQDDLVVSAGRIFRRAAAECSALTTMASMVTSRASLGSGSREFSSIMRVSRALVERAPVHADAHRLLVLDGDFDHGAEVVVVLAADADVAGIDAVLGERAGALGILLQQQMAVVVEVADDGDADAEFVESRRRSWATAAAASSLLTVTRTSSDPARARAATCFTVEGMSAVSVLVIDCTTTGASLPTRTPPIEAVTVFLRCIWAMGSSILPCGKMWSWKVKGVNHRGHRVVTEEFLDSSVCPCVLCG